MATRLRATRVKNLTFGGAHAQGSNSPTVEHTPRVLRSRSARSTAITFTSGVSTVSGSSNGVMTLYKDESVEYHRYRRDDQQRHWPFGHSRIRHGEPTRVRPGSIQLFHRCSRCRLRSRSRSRTSTAITVADNALSVTLTPSTGSITAGCHNIHEQHGVWQPSPRSSGTQTYLGITLTAGPTSIGTGIPPPRVFDLQRDSPGEHRRSGH